MDCNLKKTIKRKLIFTVCLLVSQMGLTAQTVNISGIINNYAAVSSIASQNCTTMIGVDNPDGFHSGDTVILMQMKGAVIDTTNTAAFGNILNLNGAGHYEYGIVDNVNGNFVYLSSPLSSTFDLSGRVQMIQVPNYNSVTVAGTLTAKKWDGASGGVLAFFASGTVTLYGDIDVSGLGFRGGDVSNNPDGNCGSGSPDFFYPLNQPGPIWNSGGAKKGEGIAELNDDKIAGKGKLANGGGGGNKHNHGGGGGANYSGGGQGGESLDGCGIDGNMGVGGTSLASYMSAGTLFMGGGGGCGDFNNNVGSIGADGGGIVIIKAAGISGSGHSILADGNDELIIGSGIADGVGGGGGGGSVYLDVPNYTTPVTVSVNGGHGGDQNPSYGCVGTGGGGGTGAVFLSAGTVPSAMTISSRPGRAGIFLNTSFSNCAGTSYYATAGDSITGGIQSSTSHIDAITSPCQCKVAIPNAFSPNNDGKNDQFGVIFQCPITTSSMRIYNRWGQLVYSTNSLANQWDGSYKGEDQPTGVYFYVISYVDPYSNTENSMSGHLTLLR